MIKNKYSKSLVAKLR